MLVELLQSETDKVVRAVAIALRNLSLDRRNKDLIGEDTGGAEPGGEPGGRLWGSCRRGRRTPASGAWPGPHHSVPAAGAPVFFTLPEPSPLCTGNRGLLSPEPRFSPRGWAEACPNTRPRPSGSYAMAELVRNVRNAQAPARPGARLEEDTVVAVLNTIHEIVSDSLDNARSLLQARGVPALVALGASR